MWRCFPLSWVSKSCCTTRPGLHFRRLVGTWLDTYLTMQTVFISESTIFRSSMKIQDVNFVMGQNYFIQKRTSQRWYMVSPIKPEWQTSIMLNSHFLLVRVDSQLMLGDAKSTQWMNRMCTSQLEISHLGLLPLWTCYIK